MRSTINISIHALLAESDAFFLVLLTLIIVFLSTLSLRRATTAYFFSAGGTEFLSTLSLRRATRANRLANAPPQISIHALLAESDERANRLANAPPQISIHALLAESDHILEDTSGETSHFYPRSPCGERLFDFEL